MEFEYKFDPHNVYQHEVTVLAISKENKKRYNEWLNENIGQQNTYWYMSDLLWRDSIFGIIYHFHNKEDAMAFKLRWT